MPLGMVAQSTVKFDEANIAATLAGEEIRLSFPFSQAAPEGTRISAHLVSPAGISLAISQNDVPNGGRSSELVLRYPRDSKGQSEESIEWYRVAYSVVVNDHETEHGKLALGQITRNLFKLSLARPTGQLILGKNLDTRAFAGNPLTHRPARGVQLAADLELVMPDGKHQTIARQAITDRSGEALLSFPIPDSPITSATIKMMGVLHGPNGALSSSSLESEFQGPQRNITHVQIDKPLYQPGQTVHLRALAMDGLQHVAANAPVTLVIKDADQKKVLMQQLTANRFGLAAYDWHLDPQIDTGTYEASFIAGEAKESSEEYGYPVSIPIQRYDLPEFTVRAELDRGYYLVGQTPEVKVSAKFLFGKPVSGGSVRLVREEDERWNPKTGRRESIEGASEHGVLDSNGTAIFHPRLEGEFDDLGDSFALRYRDLTFHAYVTDTASGKTEPRKFSLRASHSPIHIYVRGLNGNDREGDFLISTSYADGLPASCKLAVDSIDEDKRPIHIADVRTSIYGLARLHLRYPSDSTGGDRMKTRIQARDSRGLTGDFEESVYSAGGAQSVWVSVKEPLLKPGVAIEAVVHGPKGKLLDLDVFGSEGPLAHQRVLLVDGSAPVTVAADIRFHGIVTLFAYALRDTNETGFASQPGVVLYPENKELRLNVSGLHKTYGPGESVSASVRLADAAASGIEGAIGIAVTDTAVDERARTEDDFKERSWGWSGWYSEHWDVGGLTIDDLNRLDMSKPLPDGIELAAEVILQSQPPLRIESKSDGDVRDQVESAMQEQIKPLGTALANASLKRLPTNLAAIHAVANDAHVDGAIFLDPWDTPYRLKAEIAEDEDVLSFQSAGPDKKFNTADDFELPLAQQSTFAWAGKLLSSMLKDAADHKKPLPGTTTQLISFAQEHGLDLLSEHDPNGKPFKCRVRFDRRWLSASCEMEMSQESRWSIYKDGKTVWTSPLLDYFGPTEEKIYSAINNWITSGHRFPETDDEILAALTAAGISIDSLHDPAGEPYRIHARALVAYAHVQKISAGAHSSESTTPITQRLQAVQILRSSLPGESLPGGEELVGQVVLPIEEQSGKDLRPSPVSSLTFRADMGAIGGTVSDVTGAVIPRARVVAHNEETLADYATETDNAGLYVISNLSEGNYSIQVTTRGFQTYESRDVRVEAASLTTLDVTLNIGAESQTVTVSATVESVATESASVTAANDRDPRGVKTFVTPPKSTSQETFTPRLRHVFEETAYWEPSLITGTSGRAAFHFRLPDSLTTWKMRATASTLDGRLQSTEQTFTTLQPLFVDLDVPQILTVGDELTLPVMLRNYTPHASSLTVALAPQIWLQSRSPESVRASIPPSGTSSVDFGFRAIRAADSAAFRVTASNRNDGDAVEKTVRVHPDGRPQRISATGLLQGKSATLQVTIPGDAIPESLHARFRISPNLAATIQHSIDALVQQPHGCAEQTISSAYPSLLLLELLRATGSESKKSVAARQFLQQGYDRLLDYFDTDGGLTYWGNGDRHPDPMLTAYGIEFLQDALPLISVQRSHIEAARNWLLKSQRADGSWDGHWGKGSVRETLSIVVVLLRSLPPDAQSGDRDRTFQAVSRATAWTQKSVSAVHDPVANALRLQLAVLRKDPLDQQRLTAELLRSVVEDRAGQHWSSDGPLPFYVWGRPGTLETTAIVVRALNRISLSESDRALVHRAALYLIENTDADGIWFIGQTTVHALKSLLPFAVEELRSQHPTHTLHIAVNGVDLPSAVEVDSRVLDSPREVDLTGILRPGENSVTVSSDGLGSLSSGQVLASFYSPWEPSPKPGTQTGGDYGLDFSYTCGGARARVSVPVECQVRERRFGSEGFGMLLAEVGLPPGADVDRESLAKLLSDGAISRYELQPDRIVFYSWSSKPEGTDFRFQFTPRYAIHAKAAPGVLYDYYNPDQRVVLTPQLFVVEP